MAGQGQSRSPQADGLVSGPMGGAGLDGNQKAGPKGSADSEGDHKAHVASLFLEAGNKTEPLWKPAMKAEPSGGRRQRKKPSGGQRHNRDRGV